MYNAPYQGVANQLSQYGRYGDSMLVHMNPYEVQGLAALSPTGKLTRNPVTGQPEAFLPFLAPILGSMLGSSLLTGTGAALLGGAGLSSAAAGAIGSGLATTLATGDLEQGIMSGLTGFGIGSALGGLGGAGADVAAKAGTDAATQAATQAATEGAAQAATTAIPEAAGTFANAPMEAFLPENIPLDQLNLNVSPINVAPLSEGIPTGLGTIPKDVGALGGSMADFAKMAPPPPTVGERFMQPFQKPGQLLSELSKPSSFLPIYVGESGRLAREQELAGRGSMRDYEAEQKAEREKTLGQMGSVFDQIRAAYPVRYRQGGQVASYAVGGGVENAIRQAAERAGYGGEYGDFSGSLPYNIPAAENVQLSLRGQYALAPPSASYSALDVGGQGYMPGFAPEFQYFTDVDPNAPPPPPPPPPPPSPPPGGLPPGGFPPGNFPPGGFPPDGFPPGDFPPNFNPFGNFGFFMPPDTTAPPIDSQPTDFYRGDDMAGGIGAFQPQGVPTGADMERINLIQSLMNQPAASVDMGMLPQDTFSTQIEDLNVPIEPYFQPSELISPPVVDDRGFDIRELIAPSVPADQGFDITEYLYRDELSPVGQEFNEFAPMEMMAEGGMTGQQDNDLVAMTVAAIRGEIENADQVIRQFVQQYGPEVFAQLREQVLQDIVPGAQTEGMVQGEGGGQDDMVEGMIGSQQRVAVSPGEYIIPADVVSLAGGGYSGDGAQFFDSLVNDIRQKTMGTTEQIKPYRRSA